MTHRGSAHIEGLGIARGRRASEGRALRGRSPARRHRDRERRRRAHAARAQASPAPRRVTFGRGRRAPTCGVVERAAHGRRRGCAFARRASATASSPCTARRSSGEHNARERGRGRSPRRSRSAAPTARSLQRARRASRRSARRGSRRRAARRRRRCSSTTATTRTRPRCRRARDARRARARRAAAARSRCSATCSSSAPSRARRTHRSWAPRRARAASALLVAFGPRVAARGARRRARPGRRRARSHETADDARSRWLAPMLAPGDVVLVKGSRGDAARARRAHSTRRRREPERADECYYGSSTRCTCTTAGSACSTSSATSPFRDHGRDDHRACCSRSCSGRGSSAAAAQADRPGNVRKDGPETHQKKAGTPTMGGALILLALASATLLWADLRNRARAGAATRGHRRLRRHRLPRRLPQDLKRKNTQGPRRALQAARPVRSSRAPAIACYRLLSRRRSSRPTGSRIHDRTSRCRSWPSEALDVDLPLWLYVPFAGLRRRRHLERGEPHRRPRRARDRPVMINAGTYLDPRVRRRRDASRASRSPSTSTSRTIAGAGELAVFCGAMVGAGIGFLWYNTYPAQVFMGDVGSLALGGGARRCSRSSPRTSCARDPARRHLRDRGRQRHHPGRLVQAHRASASS